MLNAGRYLSKRSGRIQLHRRYRVRRCAISTGRSMEQQRRAGRSTSARDGGCATAGRCATRSASTRTGRVFTGHSTPGEDFTDESARKRVYDTRSAGAHQARLGASPPMGSCSTTHTGGRRGDAEGHGRAADRSTACTTIHESRRPARAERDRRRTPSRAAPREAVGAIPGVAVDPRHGGWPSARHLRRAQHPARGIHQRRAAALQGPHRRGLPHRPQPGARWVLLPRMERDERWCSRCSTRTRRSPRASPRTRAFDDPAPTPARRRGRHRDEDVSPSSKGTGDWGLWTGDWDGRSGLLVTRSPVTVLVPCSKRGGPASAAAGWPARDGGQQEPGDDGQVHTGGQSAPVRCRRNSPYVGNYER